MDKTKRKNSIGKVYKPEGSLYWGVVVVIVIILIHFFFMSSIPHDDTEVTRLFNCFFIPFYAFIIFVMFVQVAQTSITMYDNGLEYRRGSSRLFVEWQDMSHIGRKSHGKSSSFGIYLHRKIQPDAENIIDKLFFGWSSDYIQLSSIVKVPSRWDGCWTGSVVDLYRFAETEFGSDLRYYAPHLFEKEKV